MSVDAVEPPGEPSGPVETGPATPRGSLLGRARDTFAVPYFLPFWGSGVLQFFAFQMQMLASQWLVLALTDSRTLLGAVGFAQGAVIVVTSPIAGVIVDRFSKRNLLAYGRVAMMAIVLFLAALVGTDLIQTWHVIALSVFVGLTMSLMQPATQTFVFDIVGRDRVQNAVALNSAGTGVAQMAGPALGGGVVALVGVTGAYLSTAAGLLLAIILILSIPVLGKVEGKSPTSALEDLREGFAYVRENRALRLILIVCAMAVFNGTFFVMRAAFAKDVLGQGSFGFGLMGAAMGSGAILGALVLSALPPFPRPGIAIAASMWFYSIGLVSYSFAFSFEYILAVEFFIGVASQAWQVSTFSGLQMAVPDHIRGRVVSMVFMVVQTAFVGQLAVGIVADSIGDQLALRAFGMVPLIVIGAILLLYHRTLKEL